jgi:hypothetical protein
MAGVTINNAAIISKKNENFLFKIMVLLRSIFKS